MNIEIQDAAYLYCTHRKVFNEMIEDTTLDAVHKDYMDYLFIGANTRPDLAEKITIITVGGTPLDNKHGYDGFKKDVFYEAKIRTSDTIRCNTTSSKSILASVTINDPSRSIYDKYDHDHPLFLFAFFIDGHLLVIFGVCWEELKPFFEDGLNKIHKKGKGSRNFSLTPSMWINYSDILFLHPDFSLLGYSTFFPKVIQQQIKTYQEENIS